MSRPPGPPPYTANDIAKLTTPTQKFVAQAELNSYIAGHELADKRDKGLLMPYRNSWKPNGAPHPDNATGSGGDLGPFRDGIPSGSDVNCDLAAKPFGPIRTNNRRGGARSRGTGRGSGAFHPYWQPQQARARFVKRAAAFANNAPMSSSQPIKSLTCCPAFTSTGKCTRFRCPDIHDTGKQALCKLYLYKDECTKGDLCLLSHQPSPHNAPHCLYYRDGRCTNSPCLFAHVNVDGAAPVCEAFGKLGYCEEGAQCANLHVYECPDFSNMGSCAAGDHCSLRHVHHASRMKAAARRSSGIPSPPNNSDLSQVEHITGDTNPPSELHAISQQHDYVAFDLED